MLPIRLIRSITTDRRAQAIGSAISVTNDAAGYNYLIGTAHRLHIERQASIPKTNQYQGEPWIEKSFSDYFKSNRRRKPAKNKYKFLVV